MTSTKRIQYAAGAILAAIGLVLASCSRPAVVGTNQNAQDLRVSLEGIEEAGTVRVELTNMGATPLAVCPCVGPHLRFIHFDLEANGVRLAYPELLFSGPVSRRHFRCLRPGESVQVTVNLHQWRPIWGGTADSSFPPVDLFPGLDTFRVRAHYDDRSDPIGSCPVFRGESTSDWLDAGRF